MYKDAKDLSKKSTSCEIPKNINSVKNSCDLGKLFRGMKALLAPKDNLCFPDYRDNRALADDIGGFFCRKINNIRNELGIVRAAMKEEDKVKDDPEVM